MKNEYMAKVQVNGYIVIYLNAERWAIPGPQNNIMDNFRAWTIRSSDRPRDTLIGYIYKYTSRGSPLRSYVVDSFLSQSSLWDADSENDRPAARLKAQLDYDNQKFVLECFKAVMQLTSTSELLAQGIKMGYTYHKYKKGEKCSR